MAEIARWYVVHTYSGYENTVSATILKAAENRKMQDMILEINIPVEKVLDASSPAGKVTEHKIFPGYILVKMIMTDESWHLVRNVRGVTGFVGADGKPVPLTEEEILSLGVEKREVTVSYSEGDSVKVIDGPLEGFLGTVEEIDVEKDRVKVVVSMFGRETPVDLELDQVEVLTK